MLIPNPRILVPSGAYPLVPGTDTPLLHIASGDVSLTDPQSSVTFEYRDMPWPQFDLTTWGAWMLVPDGTVSPFVTPISAFFMWSSYGIPSPSGDHNLVSTGVYETQPGEIFNVSGFISPGNYRVWAALLNYTPGIVTALVQSDNFIALTP